MVCYNAMRNLIREPIFYVYEHWRPDEGVCFYVGKGKGDRAWQTGRRNSTHAKIVKRLAKLDLCVEVRLVQGELLETDAWELEKSRISFWRAAGIKLTNITDGGEGPSGRVESLASRKKRGKKISKALTGKKHGPEWVANMRASLTGYKHPPEFAEAIRARQVGKKHTPEWCANIKAALHRPEITPKLRYFRTPEENAEVGKKVAAAWTPERRAAQAEVGRRVSVARWARVRSLAEA